jgi:hypothetical protein
MADDEKQVLEAARRLPLEERVEHKNWKVRSEALDHIKEQCSRARSSQEEIFAEAGERTGLRSMRSCARLGG